MTLSSLSVGVIGAGEMVARYHLPTLHALKPVVRIDWLADSDYKKARLIGNAYGVKPLRIPEQASALPATDVVLVAIPYGARGQYWKSLRERSSAVYLEKPIAQTVAEHREMCTWFAPHRLGCGYQRRSWGGTLLLKELIETELFGSLERIRLGFGSPGTSQWSGYSANVGLAGGGVLFEFAVHWIDQMLFCTSATSVNVQGVQMIVDEGYDLHTEALVSLTVKNRSIACDMTISRLKDTSESMEFDFKQASVIASYLTDDIIVKSKTGRCFYRLLPDRGPLHPKTPRQTLHSHWCEFLGGIRTATINRTSAAECTLTTELLEALYRAGSAES